MSKTIQISLSKTNLFAGGQSLIDVRVKSPATPIGSVAARLTYPANLVKIKDIQKGDAEFEESAPLSNLTKDGEARFIIQQASSLTSPIGEFIVARLLIEVLGQPRDVVNIHFQSVGLVSTDSVDINGVKTIDFKTKIK